MQNYAIPVNTNFFTYMLSNDYKKRWLLSKKDVIPIPGAKNIKQAKENADSAAFKLKESETSEMESLSSEALIDYLPQ